MVVLPFYIAAAVQEHEQQLHAAKLAGDEQALAQLRQAEDPSRWYGRIGVFRKADSSRR